MFSCAAERSKESLGRALRREGSSAKKQPYMSRKKVDTPHSPKRYLGHGYVICRIWLSA
jgi:hypothetical protein